MRNNNFSLYKLQEGSYNFVKSQGRVVVQFTPSFTHFLSSSLSYPYFSDFTSQSSPVLEVCWRYRSYDDVKTDVYTDTITKIRRPHYLSSWSSLILVIFSKFFETIGCEFLIFQCFLNIEKLKIHRPHYSTSIFQFGFHELFQ